LRVTTTVSPASVVPPEAAVFQTPKPERLIRRIVEIASNSGDLILDSFAGSGTTGAVAHKMGRRWIMVELGDHCRTHIIPRLMKVIEGGDKGGITEAVAWKGGGGFRYFGLAPSLLEKDRFGNWVVARQYNSPMLAEAMCKLMGFRYAPSLEPEEYWKHGTRLRGTSSMSPLSPSHTMPCISCPRRLAQSAPCSFVARRSVEERAPS
jgi:hypothetical protein